MAMDHIQLAILSTLSALLPISFCGWALLISAEKFLRFFLCFLVFGFIVDCMGWYQYVMDSDHLFSNEIRRLYGLVEAIFFLWFLSVKSDSQLKRVGVILIYLIIPIWLVFEILIPQAWLTLGLIELAYFQGVYRICVAFLATILLLKMVESQARLLKSSSFWLIAGILIYNFSTFFIMVMQRIDLAERLWYLHNLVNIITYLIYCLGFYYSSTDKS